jgi:site-specific recombinase XerD
MEQVHCTTTIREPWNKGKLVGQKAPFKLKEIWTIRVRLQLANRRRELALFNLAIDSKRRACDLVRLSVRDVCHGGGMASRAIVLQQKTQRPVQFEITEPTRDAVGAWIGHAGLTSESSLFPSRLHGSVHLSTRQYARIVHSWVRQLGLEKASYWTHTLRRTKATLICRRTKNLRAVQLLLGHTKLESTVRYLGIEVNDALEMAEQTEV